MNSTTILTPVAAKPEFGTQREQIGYLPTLDGWRAVAILAVIFHHDQLVSIGPLNTGWLFRNGYSGVDLFFAISGLLICSRLLEDEHVFGRISLCDFYIRRAFRILPPALAFLAVIAILSLVRVIHVNLHEWIGSLLFFRNYVSLLGTRGPDAEFTEHFWSLSVEEHFYLILPGLLVLTRKHWRLRVLFGLAVLVEAHRMIVLQSRPWILAEFHTDFRLDSLLIPAIFAVLIQKASTKKFLKSWLRFWPILGCTLIAVFSSWNGAFWQTEMVAFFMPMMILGTVLNPLKAFGKVLEWLPVKYIGRISYSLYLWQELFLIGHFYKHGFPLGVLQSTSLRYAATLVFAAASYHFLEKPMIRVGHRLAPPATPGRDDYVKVAENGSKNAIHNFIRISN